MLKPKPPFGSWRWGLLCPLSYFLYYCLDFISAFFPWLFRVWLWTSQRAKGKIHPPETSMSQISICFLALTRATNLVHVHWRDLLLRFCSNSGLFAESPSEVENRVEKFLFHPLEGNCAHKPNDSSKNQWKNPSETPAFKHCAETTPAARLRTGGFTYVPGILNARTKERQPKLSFWTTQKIKLGCAIRASSSHLLRTGKYCSRFSNERWKKIMLFFQVATGKYRETRDYWSQDRIMSKENTENCCFPPWIME